MLHRNNYVYVVCLLITWWASSAMNSILVRQLLKTEQSVHVVGLITSASTSPGLILYIFLKIIRPEWLSQVQSFRELLPIVIFHLSALLPAYYSLAYGRVSLVQTVKAFEPVLAYVLSALILGTTVNIAASFALCLIVVGAYFTCQADSTFRWEAFFLTFVSALFWQLRNVWMKKMTMDKDGVKEDVFTAFITFTTVTMLASCISIPCSLVQSIWQGTMPNFRIILAAGISHFVYNAASFGILALILPTTHSLLNNGKRVFIVGCAYYWLTDSVTGWGIIGLFLVVLGTFLYCLTKDGTAITGLMTHESTRSWRIVVRKSCILLLPISLCLLFLLLWATNSNEMETFLSTKRVTKQNLHTQTPCILLHGAFANGNLGDIYQPDSMRRHILSLVPNASIRATSMSLPPLHTSGFEPEEINRALQYESIVSSYDFVLIGGGGLLALPHWPMKPQDWMGISSPYAIVAVGANRKTVETVSQSVSQAAFISGRDSTSLRAINRTDVVSMADPILTDPGLVSFSSDQKLESICWVLRGKQRKSIDQEATFHLIANIVDREEKVLNIFPKHTPFIEAYGIESNRIQDIYTLEQFHDATKDCGTVISGRQHGLIFAALSGKRVLGFENEYSSSSKTHLVTDEVMQLKDCYLKIDRDTTRPRVMAQLEICQYDQDKLLNRLQDLTLQFRRELKTMMVNLLNLKLDLQKSKD